MAESAFDPYATLGVARTADPGTVRDAYRRLARLHHPDRSTDPEAPARMQRINRAWQILSDPARRARYDADAALRRAPAGGHWTGAPRRSSWDRPPGRWPGAATARRYPAGDLRAEDDGPAWRSIVVALALLLLAGPFLFAFLPVPIAAIAVLVLARFALDR